MQEQRLKEKDKRRKEKAAARGEEVNKRFKY